MLRGQCPSLLHEQVCGAIDDRPKRHRRSRGESGASFEYRTAAAAPMDDSLGRDLHWTCHDLGIDRLMSLSRGCRRAVYRCNAIGVEGDQRFLDRNASAGGLDNHCAADAPQPPAPRRLGPTLFETVPVRKPLGFGKQTLEVAAIVAGWNWTRRDGVGELVAA